MFFGRIDQFSIVLGGVARVLSLSDYRLLHLGLIDGMSDRRLDLSPKGRTASINSWLFHIMLSR